MPHALRVLEWAAAVSLVPVGVTSALAGLAALVAPGFASLFLFFAAIGLIPGALVFVLPCAALGLRRSTSTRPLTSALVLLPAWLATLLVVSPSIALVVGVSNGRLSASSVLQAVALGPALLVAVPPAVLALGLSLLFLVLGRRRLHRSGESRCEERAPGWGE
ncbi:hypothetical protein C5C18_01010 [Rathayibacter tritici]|uniref:Uncharacterized protein n=1 Tax=Rathayibacter tritici TaxID=33888 RepID=A0A160KTI2_9MICO|nr:hypothetical protein [Rathayibacter tritici]AND16794.1 hypothetical protein A6122_1661 [Rathayibacter tritici]PPF31415.1 hypothetical protein C5C06_01280 [Rathayibacter tritici]PPF67308.1 hypothetical protein C5C21_07355 [Rathayibacter tritici]PPG09586.1 hypothetical protein C5C18_01010 [Rathayibacter tritici]PPI14242.1 hypothetical protein C5D07_09305 [Rathayibacter tritici]